MSTYLVNLDRECVCQSTRVSRLVCALVRPWDYSVKKGHHRPQYLEYLEYEDHILAETFEMARERLPWSVHLIPEIQEK